MSSVDFESCLQNCIDKNGKITYQLEELRSQMEGHHMTCNSVKTASTVVSTAGTGILVASVLAIPFTGGLSLLGTGGGLAMSVGGGATAVITEVVDSYKTKDIVHMIHDLVGSAQKVNSHLQKHFDSIRDMEQQLVSNDISHEEAFFSIMRGIANESIVRIDSDESTTTVRLLTTLSRLSHAEEFLLKTSELSIRGLHIAAPKALSYLTGLTGQLGANAAKLAGRASLVFSLATTIVDISLLISDWTSNHPTIKVIDEVLQKISEQNRSLIEIHALMDELKERVYFTVIDTIPIVAATDLFNEVAVHLLNNVPVKCQHILKNNYQIDFSFKHLETCEDIALFLTKHTGAAVNFDQEQVQAIVKKSGKGAGQVVRDLVKNLWLNIKDYEKTGTDSKPLIPGCEHVINNKVILIYSNIIDNFVRQTYGCSFTEMTRIPTDSQVYQDYYNPLPESVRNNIENVMSATIPGQVWYINANAIIFGLIIHILCESSKEHMTGLYNTSDSLTTDTDCLAKIRSSIVLVNQFRVYVDEFALLNWLQHHSGNRSTFDESGAAIQAMLQNLCERMMTWVSEIKNHYPNRLYPEL